MLLSPQYPLVRWNSITALDIFWWLAESPYWLDRKFCLNFYGVFGLNHKYFHGVIQMYYYGTKQLTFHSAILVFHGHHVTRCEKLCPLIFEPTFQCSTLNLHVKLISCLSPKMCFWNQDHEGHAGGTYKSPIPPAFNLYTPTGRRSIGFSSLSTSV